MLRVSFQNRPHNAYPHSCRSSRASTVRWNGTPAGLMSDLVLDVIVTNAVLVLKSLVQIRLQQQQNAIAYGGLPSHSFSPLEIISRLARRLDEIRHPKARACVLWLVGQYAASPETAPEMNGASHVGPEGITPWAPDVLRKAAKSFGEEVRYISAPWYSRLSIADSVRNADGDREASDHHSRREAPRPFSCRSHNRASEPLCVLARAVRPQL